MIDEFLFNLEEEIKAINAKLDNMQHEESIEVLGTTDIMSILGCNRNTALRLFNEPTFPAIKGINSNKVEKKAFLDWLRSQNKLNSS